MAQLVLLLPARRRADHGGAGSAVPDTQDIDWVLSSDGQRIARQGRNRLADLPPADTLVAVCPPTELAWHRLDLPKAPPARLQAALAGLLEERLLEDTDQVQFAVQPGAQAGHPTWVATLHRPWLQGWLTALAAQQRTLDRLVPLMAPGADTPPAAHVFVPDAAAADAHRPWLIAASAEATVCMPLAGTAAGALLQPWAEAGSVAWSASPAAATATERALGRPVDVRNDADVALAAARGRWQLLQFELAPKRRGLRTLAQAMQALRSPAWRPLRWGLLALVAVNLVGLNAYAWQQRQALSDRQRDMAQLLRDTHPQVRAVLNAPLQMRTETERLRAATGAGGEQGLEALLGTIARVWPAGVPAPAEWQFQSGRISLPQTALPPAQAEALRQRLSPTGFELRQESGRWWVVRGNGRPAGPGQSVR